MRWEGRIARGGWLRAALVHAHKRMPGGKDAPQGLANRTFNPLGWLSIEGLNTADSWRIKPCSDSVGREDEDETA